MAPQVDQPTDERITRLADGLFFVRRGWLSGNHLVDSGPDAQLIDTGFVGGLDDTLELIRACGLRLRQVRRIINTHAHCDHIGGNLRLQQISGCAVALHEIDRAHIDQRNGWATWWWYYHQPADFFPTHETLADGDVIVFGGMEWQVLHVPGHAMGQIALFCPDTGWLISSDAAWDGDFGALSPRIEGLDAAFRMRDSLRRLARLPVSQMLPGHGPLIGDGRAALEKCLERITLFLEDPQRIGWDQMRKIVLYGLLMHGPTQADELVRLYLAQQWFHENSELYFPGKGESILRQAMDELLARGILRMDCSGRLACTLPA